MSLSVRNYDMHEMKPGISRRLLLVFVLHKRYSILSKYIVSNYPNDPIKRTVQSQNENPETLNLQYLITLIETTEYVVQI